ncbi:mCG140529, isoform CRA_c [Mus musculus]|nr:mCG140529, isoform CRA_c [Mus musculus]
MKTTLCGTGVHLSLGLDSFQLLRSLT